MDLKEIEFENVGQPYSSQSGIRSNGEDLQYQDLSKQLSSFRMKCVWMYVCTMHSSQSLYAKNTNESVGL
jgi:hypothetical protein